MTVPQQQVTWVELTAAPPGGGFIDLPVHIGGIYRIECYLPCGTKAVISTDDETMLAVPLGILKSSANKMQGVAAVH